MPSVLFVCVENSCRSQMADGWARAIGGAAVESYSAGSRPSGSVNPLAVAVMGERGIDISKARSKGFAELPVEAFDYVVGMGCGDTCPLVAGKEHRNWQIDDPKGKDITYFRACRDAIEAYVRQLLREILI
jgi:arsenate reductase